MPKQITAPQIIIELEEDPEISEFLSYQKKSTQHTYTSYFRRLKEFYDVTGKEMLADPELWKKKYTIINARAINPIMTKAYLRAERSLFFSWSASDRFFLHLPDCVLSLF